MNDRQYQGINRTICIGLGGTGKDVLMRVRRLIVDRYKDLSNLPVVSFIHIDTDKEATQSVSLRTGNIYQGVDLGFQDAEKVNATMTSTQITELVQGLEQCNPIGDQPSPYAHIAEWFPPQLLRNVKAIDQGAKGIRPIGRLSFFHNYLKIKQAIEIAEQRTRGHEQDLLKQSGLIVDPGLNIIVVGSLCGGTGSGTFLDMAYSLRYAYPEVKQLVGYLVVSPELYGNTPNMCANTYAALMELDYYSSPGTTFKACYDQRYDTHIQEKRPPFDYTYLVSKSTEQGNYVIDKQRKLCNVIANKIALDFSSELAPVVKGMRDNFAQHLIQEDDHPRPNTQNYLTFGLAAIYFPRDRISQITVTRISHKLANFWLQGEGQSPDPLKLLEQFFIEYHWHNNLDQKNGLISKLEEIPLENEKNFNALMNMWKSKLENKIAECKTKEDRSSLIRQLQRDFREQFYKTKSGDTESTRGAWLTKVIKGKTSLITQLCEDIDSYLYSILEPNNKYFSITNSRNWLDAIQSELNAYQYDIEGKIKDINSASALEHLEKKWTQINKIIQDIEEEFKLVFNNKNSRVQDEARKAVKETETAIKQNLSLSIALEALEVVRVLQQHVQVRASQLTSLSRSVEELKISYEKDQIALKQSNSDEMSGEEIFSEEDIEACYEALLPQREYRAQAIQITRKVLAPVGEGQSLAILLTQSYINTKQLKHEIDTTVNQLFGSRSADTVESVIKRFNQKYPTLSERPVRLGQIIREAQPLLPLNLTAPYFHNSSAKKSQLIGFKDTDEPEVQHFHEILTNKLAIPDNELKSTQNEDKVLLVTEYAAFPLRLIDGLEKLKNHYVRLKNHPGNAPLHNHRSESFTEIIPPPVKEMLDLQDVFYPCLALNLIQTNPVTQQLEFQYFDDLRGEYYPASLDPAWKKALQELIDYKSKAEALQDLLDGVMQEIEHQPRQWQEDYLPKLRQFVQQVDSLPDSDVNYPYRLNVVGSRGGDSLTAKEGIINRFQAQIQQKFMKKIPSKNNNESKSSPLILTGEVMLLKPSVEPEDNRTRRRLEIESLRQDLAEGILTQEEYEQEYQQIIAKYPLR
ncbi:tubulin-like doman-containing protein [Gloeocapsopsis dulcis]|nr:tubulin-like doman-containing protein [Gloeocapsopsis dulcis]WNN88480.1 tubulin-like doman-containing protein [Gloeocapsopsis dulcis]